MSIISRLTVSGILAGFTMGLMTAPAVAADRPVLSVMPVYTRDYAFLADPQKRTEPLDRFKYISLGDDPQTYLSLNGETRIRYEDFSKNPGFGINAPEKDDFVLQRVLIGADLHLGTYFRIFAQLGYTQVNGKAQPLAAADRSGSDWQQAFAEIAWPLMDGQRIVFRAGRQEMPFGSQRLVALRDGPNLRQSFDALRLDYMTATYTISFFAAHPVRIGTRDFDDSTDFDQDFYGIYTNGPIHGVRGLNADLYIFQLNRKNARFAQGVADEKRTSIGTRLWGNVQRLDYNFETVYQFGSFGTRDIQAWTFASDTGFSLTDSYFKPRLGLKADIASGDKSAADDELNTFNALFPKGSYFTENGLIGPANIVDLQPNITLVLTREVSLYTGVNILWRQSTKDAVYKQPNTPIVGSTGVSDRYTGTQYFITPSWQIDPHLSLNASYVHFAVGRAIRMAQGRDSDYFGTWLTYRF